MKLNVKGALVLIVVDGPRERQIVLNFI